MGERRIYRSFRDLNRNYDHVEGYRIRGLLDELKKPKPKHKDIKEMDTVAESLNAVSDLQLHRIFTRNPREEQAEFGHAIMSFDWHHGIEQVSLRVGAIEEGIAERTICLPEINEDKTQDDVRQEFISQFSELGEGERFLLFKHGLLPNEGN